MKGVKKHFWEQLDVRCQETIALCYLQ